MKEKLFIKNFGPIQSVEIELGRFTILIGEQATGKSTVAKLLAVCRYFSYIVEYKTDEWFEHNFIIGLNDWGLNDSLKEDTSIFYANADYEFSCKAKKVTEENGEYGLKAWITVTTSLKPISRRFELLLEELKAVRTKISNANYPPEISIPHSFFQNDVAAVMDNPFYLPAERGLQSIFSLGKSSIQNLSDALFNQLAKLDGITRLFTAETPIEPVDIIYKNVNGKGFIRKKIEDAFYSLFNAATGYQSIIPVVLSAKYYNKIRRKKKTFIVEEPELNLFPDAQNKLMEFMIDVIINSGSSVLVTTHSPYILTSLNNCIYAAQVGKSKPDDVMKIIPQKYWLDINEVSAYQLMSDGTVKNIVDTELNQIKVERIDEISDELSKEWHRLADTEFSN